MPMTTLRARFAWLIACVLAIGAIGDTLTGSQYWYLSIPAILAIGWLFLADPTRCEPPRAAKRDPM